MIRSKLAIIISLLLVISVLVVISLLSCKLVSLSKQLENNQSLYDSELELNKVAIDELTQNIQMMSIHNNEIRHVLNMSSKQLIHNQPEQINNNGPDATVTFFDAFNFLMTNDDQEKAAGDFSGLIEDIKLNEYLTERQYDLKRKDLLEASVLKDNTEYILIKFNYENKRLDCIDITGKSYEIEINDSEFFTILDEKISFLDNYYNKIKRLKKSLIDISVDEDVMTILKERELIIKQVSQDKFDILVNGDKSLAGFYYLKQDNIILNKKNYLNFPYFKADLLEFLNTVSNRTISEKVDDRILVTMESVFEDEGFKVLLNSSDCKTDLLKREDKEFIYYDIFGKDGSKRGSFALQKNFGEVLLLTGDGKYIKSIKSFTSDNNLKSIISDMEIIEDETSYSVDISSDNFLVIGTHEDNADTMIIVNANKENGEINMISIPRDLYYKGDKINRIFEIFGPKRLCSELSEITGLEINKYISVDMFAFIDVIDILGGIDVSLDEDLIDPTYKVKNNGVWSTLFYKKGTHHLGGVAALRVVRSRHGSSDFDRSKRQQQVIKSIMDQMKSLNGKDVNKIYDFVSSTSNYINTNLTIADIVKNFLTYKDNEIINSNVINTDNILYASYTNTYLLTDDEKKIALDNQDFNRGLWIVLPNNNDWSLIKKHINNVIGIGI